LGNAFVRVVEFPQAASDDAEARDFVIFVRAIQEGLKANTYPKERFAGFDVCDDGLRIVCLVELRETVTKATDTRQNEDLGGGIKRLPV
jgi:hypothetical protein